MIDDYEKAMELVEEMKAHLPIPVHAGPQLIQMMRNEGVHLKAKHTLAIEEVLYLGDDGGIMCALAGMGPGKVAYVCSLTHLKVEDRHPLAKKIRAYQRERTKRLAQQASMRRFP
ncbi:MAG: hypothetical protein FJ280_14470 [Planctomycetes bacterium]|nr:hypothetical protein [Planctomycetota bacterium]